MRFVAIYLALYAITLAVLVKVEHFEIGLPLFVLAVFGGAFTLISWWLTRGAEPVSAPEPRPGIVWYLVVIAVFTTWGLAALPASQPLHDVASMVSKLAVAVVVPWLLFDRKRLPLRFNRRDALITITMSAVLLVFQFFVGRGGREIASSHTTAAHLATAFLFAFVWLSIEAGLVEEYFFRRLLQTRLETMLRSTAGGIVVTSLIFGLVHVPGLYLRTSLTGEGLGTSPSLLLSVGYAIVVLSPTGFFLGTLWSRTRNLAILVLVHGAGDLLPDVIDVARHFRLMAS